MPVKDPTTWSMATWFLAIGMAAGGGFVNWYAKVKQGHTRAFNVVELVGEIFISGFVGLAVFMASSAMDQSMAMSAALSGVGGHMGTRLLFVLERFIESKLKTLVGRCETNSPDSKQKEH